MQSYLDSSVLVVLEDGGEWPRWLPDVESTPGPQLIRGEEGEAPAEFAARVGREATEAAEGTPTLAVIACNERADAAALRARKDIACAILSRMARAGTGDLLFTESQRQSGGSRAALSALATDLASEWEDVGLRVSVRFGQPSRPPQERFI